MNSQEKKSDKFLTIIFGTAVLLGVLQIILFLFRATLPILAEIPMFIPMVHVFLILETFAIAVLALGRHHALKDKISYWIGIAFGSFTVSNLFYILTWPGTTI